MYLYLGQEQVIYTKDIVGIFDLDNASTSRITKRYLAQAQKEGRIVEVSPDIPKSFVVSVSGETSKVYLSQISPGTLKKRTSFLHGLAMR